MTQASNSRLAGTAYLLYVAAGMASMALPADLRPVLGTVMSLCALALGVALFALTSHVDRDLATAAMLCRILEAAGRNSEIFFAIGSTIFCLLLLRGRVVHRTLASLGLIASAGLTVLLIGQQAMGLTTNWSSPVTWVIWLPLLVFELAFAAVALANRLRLPASANDRPTQNEAYSG
ncbi:MAG: hypothetical protein P3A28_05225 [Gemmatimonadota bacterium]|nr:hypothetical protein [Gemmatimonadota bacterium]